ncbi:MAG: DUF2283 domain-containing protein [Candidatus Melainabacteria bacterium]|nr:DUF2283 domain-containing protein [Candidatus Melainabacteria bacterium]
MKFRYYQETDSLYINLAKNTSSESIEVSPGVVVDYDSEGDIVGIDIDQASKKVDMTSFETDSLPFDNVSFKNQDDA